MSTLKTNTLSNVAGTSSTAIENAINGSAKAWVNFNGTGTVAIRAGYNVSSITDNGTGNYTVNFTNAFSDTNYSATTFGRADIASPNSAYCITAGTGYTKTTTAMQIVSRYVSGDIDVPEIGMAFFR
jgi:hypothetical protein